MKEVTLALPPRVVQALGMVARRGEARYECRLELSLAKTAWRLAATDGMVLFVVTSSADLRGLDQPLKVVLDARALLDVLRGWGKAAPVHLMISPPVVRVIGEGGWIDLPTCRTFHDWADLWTRWAAGSPTRTDLIGFNPKLCGLIFRLFADLKVEAVYGRFNGRERPLVLWGRSSEEDWNVAALFMPLAFSTSQKDQHPQRPPCALAGFEEPAHETAEAADAAQVSETPAAQPEAPRQANTRASERAGPMAELERALQEMLG